MKNFFIVACMLVAWNAHAQWEAGEIDGREGIYAVTANDDGALFGRYCYFKDQNCVWLMTSTLRCTPGASYPALASSTDATNIQVVCGGPTTHNRGHRYFLTPYDAIEGLVEAGGILGIALVAQSGTFRVSRFDLTGAKRAMEQANTAFERRPKTREQKL